MQLWCEIQTCGLSRGPKEVRQWALAQQAVYAYGINLLPAERVAEEVMKRNAQLAQTVRETSSIFALDDLDQRFQTLLQRLENDAVFKPSEDYPPIVTREQ